MTDNQSDHRLKKMETKLNWLVVSSVIQSCLLGLVVIRYWFPSNSTLILILIILLLFVAIFHRKLPGWAGRISRFIFAQLHSYEEPDLAKKQPAGKKPGSS